MATLATPAVAAQTQRNWFWQFLRDELEPYPRRVQLATRMVITATVLMLICLAYRVPYAFQAAITSLLVSRESTKASLNSVLAMATGLVSGTVFVIISAGFFTINPAPHFIWVGCALFVVFFALATVNSYVGVLLFSVVITAGLPLWDRPVPAEVNVEDTLWLAWAGVLGAGVTILVELAFARLSPGDNVIMPVVERLDAVEQVLRCYADGRVPGHDANRKLNRYAMLGTSLARRNARRSGYNLPFVARAGGVISLVGTLVDTTAGLSQLVVHPSDEERRRARELADALAQLRAEFLARKTPAPIHFKDLGIAAPGLPLLRELEQTIELIPQVFADPPALRDETPSWEPGSATLLAHDAFTNIEHLQFAVRGTIAAFLCYVLYTSIDWPGISTSVVTCTFTALTTIGSSRQKQVLRLLGAAAGGFVFGMGVQIFVFPYIDTIFGFTIVYVLVTALAAWITTASPRISYLGVQLALAFYLIHLQSYRFETSLSIARDRVVGVLLGLFAMWLIFDQLWGRSAGSEMKKTFTASLRLLAQLAREPDLGDRKDAIHRIYALGQTINATLDQVRNLGDAVLFEFGASRAADLAMRDRIKTWSPKVRALFLIRGAMLRYRLAVPGFELPPEMEPAQKEFDHELSETLDDMAERMEGNPSPRTGRLKQALAKVEDAAQVHPSPHLADFLALCRTETQIAVSVAQDIKVIL